MAAIETTAKTTSIISILKIFSEKINCNMRNIRLTEQVLLRNIHITMTKEVMNWKESGGICGKFSGRKWKGEILLLYYSSKFKFKKNIDSYIR